MRAAIESETLAQVGGSVVVDRAFSAVKLEVSRHQNSFAGDAQLAYPRGILLGLHQRNREIIQHPANERTDHLVPSKRSYRDPAIDERDGNRTPATFTEQMRP